MTCRNAGAATGNNIWGTVRHPVNILPSCLYKDNSPMTFSKACILSGIFNDCCFMALLFLIVLQGTKSTEIPNQISFYYFRWTLKTRPPEKYFHYSARLQDLHSLSKTILQNLYCGSCIILRHQVQSHLSFYSPRLLHRQSQPEIHYSRTVDAPR